MATDVIDAPVTAGHRLAATRCWWVNSLIVVLIAAGTLGAVFGGPGLGDHEAIVAQCARHMRTSGDWVVPQIFDTPFFRKPPLPYWLIAAVSYLLPNDARTGLPVTTLAARLPSAAAAMVTVLLLWRLAASMFGSRIGRVTAVISGSSLVFLLYAPNATAEMLLTMCCTWAYLHFWYAATARQPGKRFVHAMLFYAAMGLGMLAKGPAPIALVAMPLFAWWYTERPLRILSREGLPGWRKAVLCLMRGLWPRTKWAFGRLWLIPGLAVFAAVFVPWMVAVAQRYPHAWDLWNWQYWQRAQGNYEDTRVRSVFYYVPIVIGLCLPWAFLLVEAVLSPWLRRYARRHRALLYAGMWAVLATAVMSLMQFKKPYYTLPAVPGLLLLLGVVADRLYGWRPGRDAFRWSIRLGAWQRRIVVERPERIARYIWGGACVAAVAAVVVLWAVTQRKMPDLAWPLTAIACGASVGMLVAGGMYIRNCGWAALGVTAVTVVAAFHGAWYACGKAIDASSETDKVAILADALDAAGVEPGAKLLWADKRPDARLAFYFDRASTYLVTPEEIVTRMVDRTNKDMELMWLVVARAEELLKGPERVYLILEQRSFQHVEGSLPGTTRVVARVRGSNEKPGKAWVVVSNGAADNP